MRILVVGGTFDNNGGKPSSLVNKLIEEMLLELPSKADLTWYNGGKFEQLQALLEGENDNQITDYQVIVWMPNVPNDMPKIRNVKEVAPHSLLVTSKRNDGDKYSFNELINHALGLKANLTIEFKRTVDNIFNMMLFDPLGNYWYNSTDVTNCVRALFIRLEQLMKVTREATHRIPTYLDPIPSIDTQPFLIQVREYAKVFHSLIEPAEEVTRFLGNASFRCTRGFPSFRDNDVIFVSKRNVNKRCITQESFVATKLIDDRIYYYSEHKPSIDTPIQLRLYEKLPQINYMIHSHCYIKGAPFTRHPLPCGALEEIDEIMEIVREQELYNSSLIRINLGGHGSIVMASTVDQLKDVPFIARPIPEKGAGIY